MTDRTDISKGEIRFNRRNMSGGFWFKLYDAFVPIASIIAHIVALRNKKLRLSLYGRKGGVKKWTIGQDDELPAVLIHVASAGEYEGALPLIDRLLESGQSRVAVSYSSPSAQSAIESTSGLWAHGFSPMDYLTDQLKLLVRLEPSVILIFKHDFWPNMIRAADVLKIPIGIINANFHAKSRRNLPLVRGFHRAFLKKLTFIWTVSEADSKRIEPLLSSRTELIAVGDTRYDRVLQCAKQGRERFKALKEALGDKSVIIAGSTWQPGERIVWQAYAILRKRYLGLKLVIAPHEPTDEALQRNRDYADTAGVRVRLFSEWEGNNIDEDVLLIDRVGVLADLYAVAWAAYVGGGFGKGVHSVIEPVAHGLPVCFGPAYHVSHEAGLLLENKGGFVVETADDLEKLWGDWLDDLDKYRKTVKAAKDVVTSNAGVTERLIERLEPFIGGLKQ